MGALDPIEAFGGPWTGSDSFGASGRRADARSTLRTGRRRKDSPHQQLAVATPLSVGQAVQEGFVPTPDPCGRLARPRAHLRNTRVARFRQACEARRHDPAT